VPGSNQRPPACKAGPTVRTPSGLFAQPAWLSRARLPTERARERERTTSAAIAATGRQRTRLGVDCLDDEHAVELGRRVLGLNRDDAEAYELEQIPFSAFIRAAAVKAAFDRMHPAKPKRQSGRDFLTETESGGGAPEKPAPVAMIDTIEEPPAVHYVDGEPVPATWGRG
jgi:hypothetical protein